MSQRNRIEILGRTYERSRTLAASLFGAALVLMIIGVAVGGPVGTIIAAVGSTLATTALVGFLSDPFLKDVLAQEIFKRVGLRDEIVRAGLDAISEGATMTVAPLLTGSRRVVIAPLDPFTWVRERSAEVFAVAEQSDLHVHILLPTPDEGAARKLLAQRLTIAESEVERRLNALPTDILKAWDSKPRSDAARLSLYTYTSLLSSGLLACDSVAVLEIGPAVRESPTRRTSLAQVFDADGPFGQWIASQLEELLLSAIPAGVRPVTAPGALPGRRASNRRDTTAMPSGHEQAAALGEPRPRESVEESDAAEGDADGA